MEHDDRPLEMLERQLAANRSAIRFRHPVTGRRHYCHDILFREAYVLDTLRLRAAIKQKKEILDE